ncbi:hypothetical protein FJ492_23955 [Mesorhizobium sp. B2-5-4]|uniref:hypothetical protein n=1 Tax=unclassified Mesorhizobium TaxID=325217 RepID=UPI00112C38E1|nr:MULTISPECIES: hypothetical protein [unclassified Mesorhizobium]TPJ83280.1 hypothetical protein FJ434_19930 [Mesorhizobium sp. B2-5-13]TPK38281.1 hypothetical protein FJ492_23955 [Mesorhizobium sp. B2-5-4]TPK42580.1 hypothetical protein FJ560_26100 [Mesorhizobium sp. B2-5-5]TPM05314.1 hypothetical protein FJ960_12880 [Mesorhizobium sp. B2-3-11]
MHTLPRLNGRYWLALVLASTFGTNTGDLMSDGLGLGHVAGLPWIIGALVLVFIAERASPWKTALFFWAAIIIIRTGATNIGDAFHDYKIDFSISLPVVLVCYVVSVLLYRTYWLRSGSASLGVNPIYWITMVLAGVLGTIGGDAASFRLGLTPVGTAIVFFALVALVTTLWRQDGKLSEPIPYWTTLALIRTGGTGAGDALAHKIGLVPSTLLTGAVFVGILIYFYAIETDNSARVSQDATALHCEDTP